MLKTAVAMFIVSAYLGSQVWAQDQTTEADSENANPAAAATPKFGSTFSSQSSHQLLAQGLPQDQVTWLEVSGEKVLSLYNADYSGKARGGVILLANPNQTINTRSLLYNLQLTLPDNRWHALTINTPENSDSQLLQSAIAFFNDKGIFNMVLFAEGSSADLIANFTKQIKGAKESKQIRGIALVNAYGTDIQEQINQLPFPVLDIYVEDYAQHIRAAKQRLRNSKGLARQQYQQVRMPRVASLQRFDNEGRLTKRIRGWLDKRAAGFSVGINKR